MTQHNNSKKLIQQMELGAGASEALTFLKDWLEEYQEWTISRLKSCPVEEMVQYRNLLLVSEAFEGYLTKVINNGDIAKADFQELQDQIAYETRRGYYPE